MPRRKKGDRAADVLDPVRAARTRIAMCEQYGLEVDPRDVQIVNDAEGK